MAEQAREQSREIEQQAREQARKLPVSMRPSPRLALEARIRQWPDRKWNPNACVN
jgi:hypothetical protein